MANIKSAIKRIEVAKRNTARNKAIKTEIKTILKKFDDAIATENIEEATALFRLADKKLKRAAHKNIIHKNAVARKISRLALNLNRAK